MAIQYISHTIYNTSTSESALINLFTFDTNPAIRHHAKFAAFGLSDDYTGSTTEVVLSKTYVTGGTIKKNLASYTADQTKTINTYSGGTLELSDVTGILPGWAASSPYAGSYVVSVTPPYTVVMSSTESWVRYGSIKFTTSTQEVTLSGTDATSGISAGWSINGTGYSTPGTVVSVKNSNTLVVNNQPSSPTIGGQLIFRHPTDFKSITVNSASGLDNNWTISGNGFSQGQYITNIVGNVLTINAEPDGVPEYNTTVSFNNTNTTLYTISPGGNIAFDLGLENVSGSINNTYASTMTVYITQGTKKALTVRNFVGIGALPPPPPAPPTYTGVWTPRGGPSGNDGGTPSAPSPGVQGGWGAGGTDGNGGASSTGASTGTA